MTPIEFHSAMRPRLESIVRSFVCTQLSFSQQKDLMQNYKQHMLSSFCPDKAMDSVMALQDRQINVNDAIADIVSVFFVTSECFHAIDLTGSLILRVNSYEARLNRYLAKLAVTPFDCNVFKKSKPSLGRLNKSRTFSTFALKEKTEPALT